MSTEERIVLIVDDEESIRIALDMVLSDAGFTPVVAINGPEALEALTKHDIGVAIVDKNLANEMSGLDVLDAIRRDYPRIKVLLHTGFPSTDSAIKALRAGAFDYVPKPTENQLIVEKVKRAFTIYELELERNELFRNYEALFEVVPGVVWFLTDHGKFRRISNQGAALLGYSSDDLVGKSYEDFLAPGTDEPSIHWAFNERRTGARATQRKMVTMVTKSGAQRVFEISSAAAIDSSENADAPRHRGTLVVGVDVTNQVGLLTQLQERGKMDALGRMAGGVAHDFNNALSVIISLSGMLREEPGLSADSIESLADIHEAGSRAADLSRQLLLFSRRHQDIEPELVAPGEVVHEVDRMLRRLIREDISIQVTLEDDLGHVRINPTQLHQVLMNLGVNASDAMPDGGVIVIGVRSVEVDEEFVNQYPGIIPGHYVQFAVGDTGSGIPRELQTRVFEPFFTTKEIGQGTGLGLAIVYGVVKQCGGHVTVYSEPTIGTTFKIYLPQSHESPKAHRPRLELVKGGTEELLLVEDNAIVRRSARRILTRHGYNVSEAINGQEALKVWKNRGPFHLVITDIVMPKMGGLELAVRLRDISPGVPVLYVSGYNGDLSNRFELLTTRAHFLEKPFTRESLTTAVRQLLDDEMD